MLTPRSTLTRRVMTALDASPSRIPVLLGGCGSGRTTLVRHLVLTAVGARRWVAIVDGSRTLAPREWAEAGDSGGPERGGLVTLRDLDSFMDAYDDADDYDYYDIETAPSYGED